MDEDAKTIKALDEEGWTICGKFTCEDCSIEPDCPFEFLLVEEAQRRLEDNGYVVLYGPGGMWGVFQRTGKNLMGNKLHVLRDEELPDNLL